MKGSTPMQQLADLQARYELSQRATEFGSIAKTMLATRGKIFEGRFERHSPRVSRIINADGASAIIRKTATSRDVVRELFGVGRLSITERRVPVSLASVGGFDRLLNGGMRKIPLSFATVGSVTATLTGGYVSEGRVRLSARLTLASQLVDPMKAAALLIVAQELAKHSASEADSLINQELRYAAARAVDAQFLAVAAAGVTSFSLAGSTAIAFRQGLAGALASIDTDARSRVYIIVTPKIAEQLAVLGATSTSAEEAFPNAVITGGNIGGMEIVVSDALAANTWMVIDASAFIASSGDIELDILDQAWVQFDTAPDSRRRLRRT